MDHRLPQRRDGRLAPGGIAKVWISGPCVSPIEVARVQGEVVKEGPSGGQTNGKYALPLEPETKAYIEKYGCLMALGKGPPLHLDGASQ
jgi:hypothetical protein